MLTKEKRKTKYKNAELLDKKDKEIENLLKEIQVLKGLHDMHQPLESPIISKIMQDDEEEKFEHSQKWFNYDDEVYF